MTRSYALSALTIVFAGCASSQSTLAPPPTLPPLPQASAGLAPVSPEASDDRLPRVPVVAGSIALRVVYPTLQDRVVADDSSFMFGSTGTGNASLTINGNPVPVWPNGAWLAWIPFPPDSVMRFELVAKTSTDSARLEYVARRRPAFAPPATAPWIDSSSISPQGAVWWPKDEPLLVSVRASEGSVVAIKLGDGRRIPLQPDPRLADLAWGIRAFDRDTANLRPRLETDRYVASIRVEEVGGDPGPMVGPAPVTGRCPHHPPGRTCPMARRDTATPILPVIEVIHGTDTVSTPWPVQIRPLDAAVLVEFDDDTARVGDTDRLTIGRAAPGATYHWFFPTGTRAVALGRINGMVRLRLSRGAEAWVPAEDAQPLPPGRTSLHARVGSMTLFPEAGKVIARIPLSDRVPFRVSETESEISIRFYGAYGDIDWIRYGGTDPLVARVDWEQSAADEVTIAFRLAEPVWGYRARWSGNDLLLEIRRPPAIDRSHPLRGRLVLVDPGHPPAGATGPTGFREAEANLAVAGHLKALLEEDGATVVLSRTTDSAVGLWERVALADSIDAELLISIHNNALPDGVNPFTNNGTSVFYNHPRSIPLAFAIQRELVTELGLPNLGVGRGDLALVRPTWMPAVLTEGLFMMLPRQEAALKSDQGQLLYARGVFEGIKDFLEERAKASRSPD
jgi:N-acetylmuramoyl-L-alanine amidase